MILIFRMREGAAERQPPIGQTCLTQHAVGEGK